MMPESIPTLEEIEEFFGDRVRAVTVRRSSLLTAFTGGNGAPARSRIDRFFPRPWDEDDDSETQRAADDEAEATRRAKERRAMREVEHRREFVAPIEEIAAEAARVAAERQKEERAVSPLKAPCVVHVVVGVANGTPHCRHCGRWVEV